MQFVIQRRRLVEALRRNAGEDMKKVLEKLDEMFDQLVVEYKSETSKYDKSKLLGAALKTLTVKQDLLKKSGYTPNTGH